MEYLIRTDMGPMSRIPLGPGDALYLGNIHNALTLKHDHRLWGFWAILNCTDDPALDHLRSDAEYDVLRLNQLDGEMYPFDSIMRGIQYIDMHLKAGANVLVACHAGVSRSAGMMVAYLTFHKIKNHYDNLTEAPMTFVQDAYNEAVLKTRKARPFIQIHPEIDKSIRQYFRLAPRSFNDLITQGY